MKSLIGLLTIYVITLPDTSARTLSCTKDQATSSALQLIRSKHGSSMRKGDCLKAAILNNRLNASGAWNGQVGYDFTPVLSTDNGHDFFEHTEWQWSAFVPVSTCEAVWVPSWHVHDGVTEIPGAIEPTKNPNWYCFN